MDLNEIQIFLKVVEQGSFTKAAQQLAMPNSTVSTKVLDLEKRLGITLIKRTTRKLFITEEGRVFYEKCLRGFSEIKLAEEELTSSQKEPQGLLKITAPVELGGSLLPKVIQKYKNKYTKVDIELYLSDRMVDLVTEGFDIAIRAGFLKDSSLKAKKLGDVYFALFASSTYLKKFGVPKTPKDLQDHTCIQFTNMGVNEWVLTAGSKKSTIAMKKNLVINDLNTIKNLVESGAGIALLPTYFCFNEIKSGKIQRILPEWKTDLRPVNFIFGGQKFAPSKVNAFIEMASELIKEQLDLLEKM